MTSLLSKSTPIESPEDALSRLKKECAALKESEAEARKLALVAARTDNAVVITDRSGRIEWCNDAFARTTGWTLKEIEGKTPGSFLQGPDSDPETVAYMSEQIRLKKHRILPRVVVTQKCHHPVNDNG